MVKILIITALGDYFIEVPDMAQWIINYQVGGIWVLREDRAEGRLAHVPWGQVQAIMAYPD